MVVKSLIIMRHAEREDRALELEGKDWISTAARPQDPLLSSNGKEQAAEVGRQLLNRGVTRILCSPMIRTVITADIIAERLGFGEKSICVETGLVEEAKSFRGKTAAEPRPNWNPLILPVTELTTFSSRLNLDYKPMITVQHVRDESASNTVREVHEHLTERDEVHKDRSRRTLRAIMQSDFLHNEVVLCVGHGATVKEFMKALEENLPEEFKIKGERNVSCFAEFVPFDPENPSGPWRSVTGHWESGDINGTSAGDDK